MDSARDETSSTQHYHEYTLYACPVIVVVNTVWLLHTVRTFCPLRVILSCAFLLLSASRMRKTSSSGGSTNGFRPVGFDPAMASSCAVQTITKSIN